MKVKLIIGLLSTILCAPAAQAQTKSQCALLAEAIPNASTPLREQADALSALDWNKLMSASNGILKRREMEAQHAQALFAAALDRYVTALQDVTAEAQRCAN